jgi:hypothetical protein
MVGVAVGVRLGKRAGGPSSSSSSATSNQNGTAGAVSSDPNDPSKFQKKTCGVIPLPLSGKTDV